MSKHRRLFPICRPPIGWLFAGVTAAALLSACGSEPFATTPRPQSLDSSRSSKRFDERASLQATRLTLSRFDNGPRLGTTNGQGIYALFNMVWNSTSPQVSFYGEPWPNKTPGVLNQMDIDDSDGDTQHAFFDSLNRPVELTDRKTVTTLLLTYPRADEIIGTLCVGQEIQGTIQELIVDGKPAFKLEKSRGSCPKQVSAAYRMRTASFRNASDGSSDPGASERAAFVTACNVAPDAFSNWSTWVSSEGKLVGGISGEALDAISMILENLANTTRSSCLNLVDSTLGPAPCGSSGGIGNNAAPRSDPGLVCLYEPPRIRINWASSSSYPSPTPFPSPAVCPTLSPAHPVTIIFYSPSQHCGPGAGGVGSVPGTITATSSDTSIAIVMPTSGVTSTPRRRGTEFTEWPVSPGKTSIIWTFTYPPPYSSVRAVSIVKNLFSIEAPLAPVQK